MKRIMLALIVLAAVATMVAAEEQVYVVSEKPTGPTIRLAVKQKGKIVDGGQFISMAEYQKTVATLQQLASVLDAQMRQTLSLLYPEAYKVLTDTSFAVIKKSQIQPPPAQQPPAPAPAPAPAPQK